jgi:hypothetical protein
MWEGRDHEKTFENLNHIMPIVEDLRMELNRERSF